MKRRCNMKKIIDELINSSISGADVYRYNDATWLIFTDETRWVVEMTDGGTLWYNHKFFNNIMRYVSMEDGYEKYITEWANDYFYNGINKTERSDLEVGWHTREVINDGVKEVCDSSSYRVQNRAENLVCRIVRHVKPNIVFHGINSGIDFNDTMCSGNFTDTSLIIEGGIKNTWPDKIPHEYDWSDDFDAGKVIEVGDKVII